MSNPRRSQLQGSLIPALLVTSALAANSASVSESLRGSGAAEKDTPCRNDQRGAERDDGCTPDRPICVNANHGEPPPDDAGVQCVPCLNYFETPMEADWGCSAAEPLCAANDDNDTERSDGSVQRARRPSFGSAGTSCIAYPCHNTEADPVKADEGCTETHPTCVDGLGNDPQAGQPGIECVAAKDDRGVGDPRNRHGSGGKSLGSSYAWGMAQRHLHNRVAFTGDTKAGGGKNPNCFDDAMAGHFSFCHGCAFVSSGSQCGLSTGSLSW